MQVGTEHDQHQHYHDYDVLQVCGKLYHDMVCLDDYHVTDSASVIHVICKLTYHTDASVIIFVVAILCLSFRLV